MEKVLNALSAKDIETVVEAIAKIAVVLFKAWLRP